MSADNRRTEPKLICCFHLPPGSLEDENEITLAAFRQIVPPRLADKMVQRALKRGRAVAHLPAGRVRVSAI